MLLWHWAEQRSVPFTDWIAEKEPATVQRRRLVGQMIGVDPLAPITPVFPSWFDLWQALASTNKVGALAEEEGHHLTIVTDQLAACLGAA